MPEIAAFHRLEDTAQVAQVIQLFAGHVQPVQPVPLVLAGPQPGVARPQALHFPLGLPFLEHGLHVRLEVRRQCQGLSLYQAIGVLRPGAGHRVQQFVEGLHEGLQPLAQQTGGDFIQGDVQLFEDAQHLFGLVQALLQAGAGPAVTTKGVQGGGRNGADGIGTDEFLDVAHVTVGGVLGAGAGPQQPLATGAPGRQGLPALAAEQLLEAPVGQPGVGDGGAALHALQPREPVFIGILAATFVQQPVHGGIHATDEETGDTGDGVQRQAVRGPAFQGAQVALRHLFIDGNGKQQRGIDMDAFGQQRLHGRKALGGGRHLDHQIGPVHEPPQAPRLLYRPRRVMGQARGHLQADIAVPALGVVVHRGEQIGGGLYVGDGQPLVNGLVVQSRVLGQIGDGLGVIRAAGNGLFKNGRVRGHPPDAVLFDQSRQVAAAEQAAAYVIQPHGLAETFQCLDRVHPFLVGRLSLTDRRQRLETDEWSRLPECAWMHLII